MTVKKIIGKVHLWLGLSSGLLVLFLGITGCILAFQREIEMLTVRYQYVQPQEGSFVAPSKMYEIATKALPGKHAHSVAYGRRDKAAIVSFYDEDYYYTVYINPYTGKLLKVKNMNRDLFRVVINGHFYLWLPPKVGQPIVATGTLVFVVMMISGIVLWWPRNKAARKQRFKIKFDAKWRRVNYDLHNVLGFYMSWVAIFIAITGLVWGFQWVGKSIYWVSSGGRQATEFYMPVSKPQPYTANVPAVDRVYDKMNALYANVETIEIHFPDSDTASIEGAANPDASTYWKTDYRYFNQYTLEEVPVTHMYGRLKDTKIADKIARMNYDIHVGAALGIVGKILAFFASLFAASLPVTGFYIWWGRKYKTKTSAKTKLITKPQQKIVKEKATV